MAIDESETVPRVPGCLCTWETGDSPCPVHDETCAACELPLIGYNHFTCGTPTAGTTTPATKES